MSARRKLGDDSVEACNAGHLADISVLVAEDQETLREIYQALLEKCGVTKVKFAENGLAAWRSLNASPFDILITDLYMPELDGRGLVERIRVSQKFEIRRLPIILITGDENYRDCTSINSYPISGCLNKPFRAPALRAALERAVSELTSFPLEVIK